LEWWSVHSGTLHHLENGTGGREMDNAKSIGRTRQPCESRFWRVLANNSGSICTSAQIISARNPIRIHVHIASFHLYSPRRNPTRLM